MLGETLGDLFGKRRREFQAHLGELDADVGIDLVCGDPIEQLVIDFGRVVRFDFGADAFAEGVKGDQHALVVEGLSHAQGVADFHSRHEAGAHAPAEAGILTKAA